LRQSLSILEQMQKPATPLAPFLAPMDWMRAMMPSTLPFPIPRVAEAVGAPASFPDLDARLTELEERIRQLEEPIRKSRRAEHDSPMRRERTSEVDGADMDRLEERLRELEARHKDAAV
jgi:hypothetical protein